MAIFITVNAALIAIKRQCNAKRRSEIAQVKRNRLQLIHRRPGRAPFRHWKRATDRSRIRLLSLPAFIGTARRDQLRAKLDCIVGLHPHSPFERLVADLLNAYGMIPDTD